MGRKEDNDNRINQILYGGEWETYDGRSVPKGSAERAAAHDAEKKQAAKDNAEASKRRGR